MKVTVYSAAWCGPCKMVHPALKREGIEYRKVDIDANLEEADRVGIRSVPTIIITKDDGEEVTRITGFSTDAIKRVKEVLNGGT
jgi:glutaredoxin